MIKTPAPEFMDNFKAPSKVKLAIVKFAHDLIEDGFTFAQLDNNTWSYFDRYASNMLFFFNGYEAIFSIISPFNDAFALAIGSDGNFTDDMNMALINCRNDHAKTWEYLDEESLIDVLGTITDLIYDAANPFKRAQDKHNKSEESF